MRTPRDLEHETIRKREEFESQTGPTLELSQDEVEEAEERRAEAEAAGEVYTPPPGRNPVRNRLLEHEARYPLERMHEIEQQQQARRASARRAEAGKAGPRYFVQAAVVGDEDAADAMLTELVDAGYDGTLVAQPDRVGRVLYEIRLGPYETLEEAQQRGRRGADARTGSTSSVLVEPAHRSRRRSRERSPAARRAAAASSRSTSARSCCAPPSSRRSSSTRRAPSRRARGGRLADLLVASGEVSADEVLQALATQLGPADPPADRGERRRPDA